MRMFVAVSPPEAVVEHLAEFLEPRQAVDGPLRWTLPEQWHVTLAFLPSVPDAGLDALTEQLAEAAGRQSSFGLRLQGAGTFPNPAQAKALWIGVAGDSEPLTRLAASSRSAAVRAGLEVDGGRFRPHLTLARANRPLEATRWLRVLELYQGPSWQVDELALVQSQLGGGRHGRTRHQVRGLIPLGAG